MKTITLTICGVIMTGIVALAQTSPTTTVTPVITGTPATGGSTITGANNNVNTGTNSSVNSTTPLVQPVQSLQGMPQSQISPAVTPTQPSPYQSPTLTQPQTQSTLPTQQALPVQGNQMPIQPTTGQSQIELPQMTVPANQYQGIQPLQPMTPVPSIITAPVSTPQTGNQQQNQPLRQQ